MLSLPPLAAVRVFEAAARHANFTRAAEELGMTQAGVSQQVRLLEDRLGFALFARGKRGVTLTEAGARIAAEVRPGLERIATAFAEARAEDQSLLTISTSNTFANTWLAWRLGGFQMAWPGMAVRLHTSDHLVDFAAEGIDVAIRSGREGWDGMIAERLLGIDFTPMCSPAFLAGHGGTITPQDLLRLPLISSTDPWWGVWLREAGVDVDVALGRSGVRLDSQAHEGNAAIAGQGVALLTPFFWRNDMAEGRLVRLFDQVSTRGYAYWLCYPEHRRAVPKIRRFHEWLVRELASSTDPEIVTARMG